MCRIATIAALIIVHIMSFVQLRTNGPVSESVVAPAGGSCMAVSFVGPEAKGDAFESSLIFAAWPNGRVVWSDDRLRGGAPYSEGSVEPRLIQDVLSQFESDGVFEKNQVQLTHLGPDLPFTTIVVKKGNSEVSLESSHDVLEATGKFVCTDVGDIPLNGQRRLDVLRKSSADYLSFRLLWSDAQLRFERLIAAASKKQ